MKKPVMNQKYLVLVLGAILVVFGTQGVSYGQISYDADEDGLIEVSNLGQLNAIRWDLDGDGASLSADYAVAFPDASPGMGCPASGCIGYELATDLDFDTNGNGEPDEGDAYWNGGAGWLPIGGEGFSATFDGNGHTISNLGSGTGLFAITQSRSVINRIGLVSVFVSGSGYGSGGALVGENHGAINSSYSSGEVGGCFDNLGGLVGTNFGSITDSYTTGGVFSAGGTGGGGLREAFEDLTGIWIGSSRRTCYTDGGGLVGENQGTITDSYSTSIVSGFSDSFGGLVGANRGGIIIGSYAKGDVSGSGYSDVGGLVGDNDATGSIIGSHATGTVSGRGDSFGGLVGANSGIITASSATGAVSGSGYAAVGGLVGWNYGGIIATYATGTVSGRGDWFGGLVGLNRGGTITASYAIGRVPDGSGLLDSNWDGFVSDSYWDIQASGQTSSDGGIGKTTQELQSPTGYTGIYSEWNVDVDGDGSVDDPWDFGTSSQYPVLKEYSPASSPSVVGYDYDVDDDGLIEVSNLAQLNAIRADHGDGSSLNLFYKRAFPDAVIGMGCPQSGCTGYELVADLDFDTNGNGEADAGDDYWNNGAGWNSFEVRTVFDGGGHSINNLYVNRPNRLYAGLFSRALRGSVIRQVRLVSADVTGNGYVGTLVGYGHLSEIVASSATGSVSGGFSVGGLVGSSDRSIIAASSADVSVSGDDAVGGLVGENDGSIVASFATGSVSGRSGVGGLVGRGAGQVTASYWETRTSGQTRSAGGMGKLPMNCNRPPITLASTPNGTWI